jgi:heterodisulfide reductase subunit A-like polyferredoxin
MALKRRDLLLGSAGMAAGLAAGSLASGSTRAQAEQSPIKWDRDTDVVVIGSGATGLPAAIIAQEAGSSVILVEAEKGAQGSARVRGGPRNDSPDRTHP